MAEGKCLQTCTTILLIAIALSATAIAVQSSKGISATYVYVIRSGDFKGATRMKLLK